MIEDIRGLPSKSSKIDTCLLHVYFNMVDSLFYAKYLILALHRFASNNEYIKCQVSITLYMFCISAGCKNKNKI